MAKFQVEQYFHVSLSLLKLGKALPFTLHIYLPVNDRIVPLIHSNEVYGQRTADLLASRKINEVYILVSDRAAYEEYVKAEGITPEPMAVGVQEPAPTPSEIAPPDTQVTQDTPPEAAIEEPKTLQEQRDSSATESSAQSTQTTQAPPVPATPPTASDTPTTAARTASSASTSAPRTSGQSSRKLASRIFGEDPGASEQALSTSRKIIRKLLEGAGDEEKKLFDVFAALDAAGNQGYASSVASYCVLFAMGIGYSDVETLRDLAVASLLHDIGTTQLPPETVWTPRNQQTPAQRREFVEHVRLGKNLLESLGFKPNARVAALIEAHHEKFDGTGYPKGIRGEKLTELSQVLSLSDFLHSLSTGYFDGKKRSPHESIAYLRELENDPLFPHYFNPNLFRRIVDWVNAGSGGEAATEAA